MPSRTPPDNESRVTAESRLGIVDRIRARIGRVRLRLDPLVNPLSFLLLAVLAILGAISHFLPAIAGPIVGAGVGAMISVSVWLTTRFQDRRKTTLEIFKEYYSAEFASYRRKAASFMRKHEDVDWSKNDPYVLGQEDDDLEGYGAVLRFWQRVTTLYDERELDRGLTQRLLSRELADWKVRILDPMAGRKGMYVRDAIVRLAAIFALGEGREAFAEGLASASRRRPPELDQQPNGESKTGV